MNRKSAAAALFLAAASFLHAAGISAKAAADGALRKASIDEAVVYLKDCIPKADTASDRRSMYVFLAALQEKSSLYNDACASYSAAAGISAGNADGMPRKSNEQLVIDAVRCALSSGDFPVADSYLEAVRNSKDETVQAYAKLYAQWSALCRADNVASLEEPLAVLKAYAEVRSMKPVQPAILLTLWYITGDESYSAEIKKRFPSSVEASIVKGDVQMMPSPFWFFVPKEGVAEQETDFSDDALDVPSEPSPAVKQPVPSAAGKKIRLQLGLFRTESNARLLSAELAKKGFDCYITEETRASGTTYYIVLTDDDASGTQAEKLRSAGYECYAVD